MRTNVCRMLLALLVVAGPVPAGMEGVWAAHETHVKGHTPKDGTHGAAHERKAPKPTSGNQKTAACHPHYILKDGNSERLNGVEPNETRSSRERPKAQNSYRCGR